MLHCCHTDCWREILCLSNSASIAAGPHPLSIQSGRSLYSAGIPRNQQRTFGCQGTHCTFWGTRRPRSHLRPSRRYQTWLEFPRILEKDYRQILALIQSLFGACRGSQRLRCAIVGYRRGRVLMFLPFWCHMQIHRAKTSAVAVTGSSH